MKLLLFLLLMIGCSSESVFYEFDSVNEQQKYEEFCENNQQREFTEDICLEYYISQDLKEGKLTEEQVKEILGESE